MILKPILSTCSVLKKCRKIGDGVYGEVFVNEAPKATHVLKIIPIEGVEEINGTPQKKFDEIVQEVIISQELSSLRNDRVNGTAGFVEVLNVRLVEGRYPDHLLNLWDDYKDRKGTESDRPDIFHDDQLYIVFELANGGLDLEAFVFKNADQSFSAFNQVRSLHFFFVFLSFSFLIIMRYLVGQVFWCCSLNLSLIVLFYVNDFFFISYVLLFYYIFTFLLFLGIHDRWVSVWCIFNFN